jgi:NAD(P)-dependent dehydrogenase (short-subunit alcohol dehydrogenase family)
MDYNLTGKHVLVTGGATGIGLAIAKVFLAEGAVATISGLEPADVVAALATLGSGAQGIACDLTRTEDAVALVDLARARAPVDILVNNVGIFEVRPFFETTDADWFRFFDVNVMSGVRMSRLIMREMLERGEGSIVFVSSESAVKPQPWILGLSRALAELTRGTRVRVNTILPGPTATAAVRAYHDEIARTNGLSQEEVVARYFDDTEPTSLIRRMIAPEEIAASVVHLAASPHLNGMAMRAEGGTIRSVL